MSSCSASPTVSTPDGTSPPGRAGTHRPSRRTRSSSASTPWASEAAAVRIEDYAETLRGHRVLHLVGKGSKPATMPITVPVPCARDPSVPTRCATPRSPSTPAFRCNESGVPNQVFLVHFRAIRETGRAGCRVSARMGDSAGGASMSISGKSLVRRWGGRAVGLTVTGVGLYIVAPSLLTMFGAWPRLSDVDEPWVVILAVLEACSLACLWWLARIALASPDDPVPDGAEDRQARRHLDWVGGQPRLPSLLATPPARSSRGVPPPVESSRPRSSSSPGSQAARWRRGSRPPTCWGRRCS